MPLLLTAAPKSKAPNVPLGAGSQCLTLVNLVINLTEVGGKGSLFSTHPGTTASWKFLGGGDYETFKEITTQMLKSEIDSTNYTVTDKGSQPLNRFIGEKELADHIWKLHPDNPDDGYYFGGNCGEQKQVDELIGKHYNRLKRRSEQRSKFSPP